MPPEPISARPENQLAIRTEEIILRRVETAMFRLDADGRIWRVTASGVRRAEHRVPLGYLQMRLMVDGHRYHVGAHRVVWWYFNGPIPPGRVINHINGQKDDNRPGNLECVTYSENMAHAHRTGLIDQRGERNPASKVDDRTVAAIRLAYLSGGLTMEEVGRRYGVSFQYVSGVVRGRRRTSQRGPVSLRDLRHNACDRDEITGRFIGKEGGE